VSLTAEILKEFEFDIGQLTLIPSDGGVFEVVVNGELIHSKKATRQHADPAQVKQAIKERLKVANQQP